MKKYEISSKGKTFEIEADRPPTEAEVEEILKANGITSNTASEDTVPTDSRELAGLKPLRYPDNYEASFLYQDSTNQAKKVNEAKNKAFDEAPKLDQTLAGVGNFAYRFPGMGKMSEFVGLAPEGSAQNKKAELENYDVATKGLGWEDVGEIAPELPIYGSAIGGVSKVVPLAKIANVGLRGLAAGATAGAVSGVGHQLQNVGSDKPIDKDELATEIILSSALGGSGATMGQMMKDLAPKVLRTSIKPVLNQMDSPNPPNFEKGLQEGLVPYFGGLEKAEGRAKDLMSNLGDMRDQAALQASRKFVKPKFALPKEPTPQIPKASIAEPTSTPTFEVPQTSENTLSNMASGEVAKPKPTLPGAKATVDIKARMQTMITGLEDAIERMTKEPYNPAPDYYKFSQNDQLNKAVKALANTRQKLAQLESRSVKPEKPVSKYIASDDYYKKQRGAIRIPGKDGADDITIEAYNRGPKNKRKIDPQNTWLSQSSKTKNENFIGRALKDGLKNKQVKTLVAKNNSGDIVGAVSYKFNEDLGTISVNYLGSTDAKSKAGKQLLASVAKIAARMDVPVEGKPASVALGRYYQRLGAENPNFPGDGILPETDAIALPDLDQFETPKGFNPALKSQRGAITLPGGKKSENLYHGTSSKEFDKFKDIAYLADDAEEAAAYSTGGILGGGRGEGKPKVLQFKGKPGKTLDISDEVNDAVMDDGNIDQVIAEFTEKARKEGYRYLQFDHPSVNPQKSEFKAKVSLFPNEDLIPRKNPQRGGLYNPFFKGDKSRIAQEQANLTPQQEAILATHNRTGYIHWKNLPDGPDNTNSPELKKVFKDYMEFLKDKTPNEYSLSKGTDVLNDKNFQEWLDMGAKVNGKPLLTKQTYLSILKSMERDLPDDITVYKSGPINREHGPQSFAWRKDLTPEPSDAKAFKIKKGTKVIYGLGHLDPGEVLIDPKNVPEIRQVGPWDPITKTFPYQRGAITLPGGKSKQPQETMSSLASDKGEMTSELRRAVPFVGGAVQDTKEQLLEEMGSATKRKFTKATYDDALEALEYWKNEGLGRPTAKGPHGHMTVEDALALRQAIDRELTFRRSNKTLSDGFNKAGLLLRENLNKYIGRVSPETEKLTEEMAGIMPLMESMKRRNLQQGNNEKFGVTDLLAFTAGLPYFATKRLFSTPGGAAMLHDAGTSLADKTSVTRNTLAQLARGSAVKYRKDKKQ